MTDLDFSKLEKMRYLNFYVLRIVEPTSKLDSLRVLADLECQINQNKLYGLAKALNPKLSEADQPSLF